MHKFTITGMLVTLSFLGVASVAVLLYLRWPDHVVEEPYFEGRIETMMRMDGFSDKGVCLTPINHLIAGGVAYNLIWSDELTVAGMDKLTGSGGVSLRVGDKHILVHSDALYRARGAIRDTNRAYSGLPVKILQVTYFECVAEATGVSEIGVDGAIP